MEGNPFVEPTTELMFIKNVRDGQFTALIVPASLQSVARWQIFVVNPTSATGTLDSYSLLRSSDGLFDLTDAVVLPDGATSSSSIDPATLVPPNASFSLAGGTALQFASGPTSVLYAKQEPATDQYGRRELLKREVRVMVAIAVVPVASRAQNSVAILDFGVGQDGRLAQVGGPTPISLPISPAPAPPGVFFLPSFTALAFDAHRGSQVTAPASTKAPTTSGTIELWIRLDGLGAVQVVVQYQSSGTNLALWVDEFGTPFFQFQSSITSPMDLANGPTLKGDTWYHLAAAWDTSQQPAQWTLYVNGQAASIAASEIGYLDLPPKAGLVMGGPSGSGLTGCLTEVRLWSVARSQADILDAMCTTIADPSQAAGPVGYWPLDEPPPAVNAYPTSVPNLGSAGSDLAASLVGAQWVPTN
jgi:hypothetical protein